MHRALLSLAAVAAMTVMTSAADAMPMAGPDGASAPGVTLVYGGCGPYGHRGPWGGCRRGGQWSGRGPGWGWGHPGWGGPRRCWWRPTPWGPRRVCR